MNNERGFITLPSWSAAFTAFSKARSTADILVHINQYWTTGIEPDLPEHGEVTVAWRLIKPMLDSQKMAIEYGRRGGAPKGNQNAKKKTTTLVSEETTENNPSCKTTPPKKTTKITDNRLQITDNPPTPPEGVERGAFEVFWEIYPRKVGKQDARRAYERAAKGKGPDFKNKILKALEDQKKSEQWTRENGRFIPHPATWLNQGRWDDQLEPAEPEPPKRYDPEPIEVCPLCGSDAVTSRFDHGICDSCGKGLDWNYTERKWQEERNPWA